MSGIEVAGIVLAVLPLAVQAAKSCSEGIDESKKLFRTKEHNETKRDLFDDLYRELVLFKRHVKRVVQVLPSISEQRCNQVLGRLDEHDWQKQSDITQALRRFLDDDFEDFEYAIDQVYHWMNGILDDQTLKALGMSKNTDLFLQNMKTLTDPSAVQQTESEFRVRLHLWRREGKLQKEIKNLKKWRKFVERITERSQCRHGFGVAVVDNSKNLSRPSHTIPRLSKELHRVLSESLKCTDDCSGKHGAKICLQTEPDIHRMPDKESLKYKLLLSTPSRDLTQPFQQWLEATVDVRSSARVSKVGFNVSTNNQEQVKSICSTISAHPWRRGHKLRFSIEHWEHSARSELYHGRKYHTSEFQFQPSGKEVKLKDTLADLGRQLDLTQRRELALELSYGMMTLSGSPWLSNRWTKEHISFFHTHTNHICHTQPLVSSDIIHTPDGFQSVPLDVMHPLPPVLSLGILLLELETGQTIESMRLDDDFVDPVKQIVDENTDFTAAIREADRQPMLTPHYKEAVLACLNEQEWDDGQGTEPSVLDERVRRRIYEQIIQKLESDLQILVA